MGEFVLVCTGGRDYLDSGVVDKALRSLKPVHVLVGDARGADQLVREWCLRNNTPYTVFFAKWDIYGKRAGPIRNREMLEAAVSACLLVFPGGRGTRDCTRQALELGYTIIFAEHQIDGGLS